VPRQLSILMKMVATLEYAQYIELIVILEISAFFKYVIFPLKKERL
jgi:hypothetical protein